MFWRPRSSFGQTVLGLWHISALHCLQDSGLATYLTFPSFHCHKSENWWQPPHLRTKRSSYIYIEACNILAGTLLSVLAILVNIYIKCPQGTILLINEIWLQPTVKHLVLATLAEVCITRKNSVKIILNYLHQNQPPHKGCVHKFSFTRKTECLSHRLLNHCHTEVGNMINSLAPELSINVRKLLVCGHKHSGMRRAWVVFALQNSFSW